MFPIYELTDFNCLSETWSTSSWYTVNFECTDHFLVDIEEYTYEYNVCSDKVSGSFNKGIKSIKQVQNPYLYGQFKLKQEEYESRGISFEIKELFHATAQAKIDSIVTNNLDWRLTNRSKYGRGVCFSPYPNYANAESSRYNGTDRAMIIADVLVGTTEDGSEGQSLPLDGDTTVGNDNYVYVKFYDDEFYPKYVVNYESKEYRSRWHR